MSLSNQPLSNQGSPLDSSLMVLHNVAHRQLNNLPDTQPSYKDDEEASLIDYSIPENRLYERPDGTIGLSEKPIGFVIGERVLAPTIEMIGSCTKNVFGFMRSGFGYFRSCLSGIYNFQILPTVSAENSQNLSCNFQSEDLPKALEECTKLINSTDRASKELYYQQGVLYQKLGRYQDAKKSFQNALDLDPYFDAANQELKKVKDPQDSSYRAAFLEELGFDIPSHYEYLSMSSLVYEALQFDNLNAMDLNSLRCKIGSNKKLIEYLSLKGWQLAKVKHAKKTDYVGMAFIHENHKSIVIAHKGTQVSSANDLANCLKIFKGERPKQYKDAEQFVQSLSKTYSDYTFSHTGHSLGAVLAELLAYYREETAVTAESPGVLNMISHKPLKEGGLSTPIVSYLSTPNVINTCNPHIGTLRTVPVPPPVSSSGLLEGVVAWVKDWLNGGDNALIDFSFEAAEVGIVFAEDIASHRLNLLLNTFNPENGQTFHRFVKRWPKGIQERMQFKKVCGVGCNPANPDPLPKDQHFLDEIYQTEKAEANCTKLSEFSREARTFLLSLRSLEKIPANLNPRILSLYQIQGDEVHIESDDSLFTAQDFHTYIERQIFQNRKKGSVKTVKNPFYECCTLEAPKQFGESKNSQESVGLLFSLSCIENLSEFSHSKMKGFIEKGDRENLEGYLRASLGDGFEDQIDQELSKVTDPHLAELNPDFGSLMFHIFSSRSHLQFLSVMHESARFFVGKNLLINAGNVPMFGEIRDFSFSCRTLHFQLKDGGQAMVQLDDHCKVSSVTCIRNIERSLVYYLGDQLIGSEFDLALSEHHNIPDWIQGGRYSILEVEKIENTERIRVGAIASQHVYDIEISYDDRKIIKHASIKLVSSSPQRFNDSYQIQAFLKAKYTTEALIPIPHDKANEVIIVQENFRDSHYEALKKIDELKLQLINALKDDQEYLDEIIRYMVERQFGTLADTPVVSGEKVVKLEALLNPLVDLIKNEGNSSLASYAALLGEAAIEANYQRFARFSGGDSFSISEAMRLFTQSHEFTEKMKGKDLILFIGNTGSGKSTSIAAMAGCRLKKIKNNIGQWVYKLEPEKQEGCPRIGQSLTTSETLFSEGFAVKGQNNLMLADTPGLGETRGRHFALCAALSIDQAFKQAGSIKAFVITIPLSTFLLDKGNGVIDLIKELHQVFPDILKEDADSVHVLVTKHTNYQDNDLMKLASEFLKDEKSEDRKLIWRTLLRMVNKGQMKVALPTSGYPTKKQLEKYSSSKGLSPNQFRTLMDTPSIKHEFADYVQSAASTWKRDVFQRYLKFFADEQANIEKIAKLEEDLKKAQKQLNDTKAAIADIESNSSTKSMEETKSYQTCLESVGNYYIKEHQANEEIRKLNIRLTQIKTELEVLSKKIEDHSTGREIVQLFNEQNNPNDIISWCNPKPGAREKAHLEGRATNEQDCVNEKYSETVVAKEKTGYFASSVEVGRDYYLVPSDRSQQKVFEQHGIVQTSAGQYKAIISGKYYELDLEKRIHPSGKKIVYYFRTHWEAGRELPWIKVEHEIPKITYYDKSLANWYTEKNILEKEEKRITAHIKHQERIRKEALEKVEPEKARCKSELLTTLKTQKNDFESQTIELQDQQNKTQLTIERGKKERIMVAVIIKARWTVAKSLKLFTQEVIEAEKKRRQTSKIGLGGNLLETCESYQEIFDKHQKEILERCQKDLGVECVIIEIANKDKPESNKDEL